MMKLLFQGVGCMAGCGLLWTGFFCGLVLLGVDDARYAAEPVEDAVIDRLEDAGKAEVAARLCGNSLPPTVGGVSE